MSATKTGLASCGAPAENLDSTTDSVEVLQDTHDDLNANANIQVGDTDVGNGNPVPVSDAGGSLTIDNANLDAPLSTIDATLDSILSGQLPDGHNVTVDNVTAIPVEASGDKVTTVAVSTSASVTDLTITAATDQKLLIVQPLSTAVCYWSFDTGSAVSSANGQIFSMSRPLVLNSVEASIRIGTGTAQTFLISKGS